MRRRNDASCSCRPGASRSSGRILLMSKGRWERRDVVTRRRNWVAPSEYFKVRDLGFDIAVDLERLWCSFYAVYSSWLKSGAVWILDGRGVMVVLDFGLLLMEREVDG